MGYRDRMDRSVFSTWCDCRADDDAMCPVCAAKRRRGLSNSDRRWNGATFCQPHGDPDVSVLLDIREEPFHAIVGIPV